MVNEDVKSVITYLALLYLAVQTLSSNHSLNCDNKSLIYLATCKQYSKQSTQRESTDQFCNRWNNYQDNAKKIDKKESCMQEHLL